MRWLKGVLVFAGLKLAELALVALVVSVIYLFFTLTPVIVLCILLVTVFLSILSFMIIYDNQTLLRLYWSDGLLMKVTGLLTVGASIPLMVGILAKVFFYVGEFYNWLASLLGFTLIRPTPMWLDFSVAGFGITFLLFIVFIIGYIWIGSNIDKTREILDKWENK